MKPRRLTRIAMLTAITLTIFLVEAQIPAPLPVPGVKPGLANIVTVYAMFFLGPVDTLCILLCRIFLGSVLSGQPVTLFYSLGGGVSCYGVMLLFRKLVTQRQLWVCSVVGAMAHNTGQICVAIWITGTPSLICYLPILMASGIIAGVFTGLCAQFLSNRMAPIRCLR